MKIDKPVEYYKELQANFKENANKYFDNLLEECGIDLEKHIEIADECKESSDNLYSKRAKFKTYNCYRNWMSGFGAISLCLGVFFLLKSKTTPAIFCFVLIPLFVFGTIYFYKKEKEAKIDEEIANEEYKEKENESWNDAWKFNQMLSDKDFKNILRQTTDEIEIDDCYTAKRFDYLEDLTGFELYSSNADRTYTNVISGSIASNPFGIIQCKTVEMRDETYTGSITASYTVKTTDAQGRSKTETRTEIITASFVYPAPFYENECVVEYFNPACSNLKFKRKASYKKIKSEEALQNYTKNKEKALSEMAEKALAEGKNFTPLADTEFEIMFNALNRNDEKEFRMMFTPLAIQNYKSLFINSPYGDDFSFLKYKTQNIIASSHSAKFDYDFSPSQIYSHDVRETREKFLERNLLLLQNIYFALAPIASIPIYLQTKVKQYDVEAKSNISPYEQEVIANSFDLNLISKLSEEEVIVKINKTYVKGDVDIVSFNVYGFQKVPKTTYVTGYGESGSHSVPVHYYEYKETKEEIKIEMIKTDISYTKFANSKFFTDKTIIYKDSILACIYNGVSRINSIKQEILKGE